MADELTDTSRNDAEKELREQYARILAALSEAMPQLTGEVVKSWTSRAFIMERFAELHPSIKDKIAKMIDDVDMQLGKTLCELPYHVEDRARVTENCELILAILSLWESLSRVVPNLLRRVARKQESEDHWDYPDDYENNFACFARTMCALTTELERLSVTHTAWLKPAAEEFPFWPMRRFLHEDANNHFPRIADALQLGRTCPIRVVGARYSLETPMNRYLFELLQELQWTSWLLERGNHDSETVEQYLRREMRFRGERGKERLVSDAEMAIYKAAFRMGRLVKERKVLAAWRDEVVLPYIEVVECKGEKKLDRLRAVPAFEEILRNSKIHTWKAGRTAIYNATTAGLNALAYPVTT